VDVTVELLADHPDLLVPLARIRWREWHEHPGREDVRWWIDTTRRETGRDGLPVTFVAADENGEAVGGVGLVGVEHPEFEYVEVVTLPDGDRPTVLGARLPPR
jgi:hypothetical protein